MFTVVSFVYIDHNKKSQSNGLNSHHLPRLLLGGMDPSTSHLCFSMALLGRHQSHFRGE